MGAYLSKPVTEKNSTDESNNVLSYGASAMQGWRVEQEDAHNSILDFDKNSSLFAVYDGHGGHEVAAYAASEFPNFIKKSEVYAKELYSQALTDSFLKFDASLVEPEVLSILKDIAGTKDQEDSDYDGEEVTHLCREAEMPLEEVIAKYSEESSKFRSPNVNFQKKSKSCISDEGCSSSQREELNDSLDELVESSKKIEPNNENNISETEESVKTEEPSTLVSSDSQQPDCTGSEASDSKLQNCDPVDTKPKIEFISESSKKESDDSTRSLSENTESPLPNGHLPKVNGETSDLNQETDSNENKENLTTNSESENIESKSQSVNGGDKPSPPPTSGKLKGHEKSIKGKSIVNNAIVQALKVARRNEKKRKAAEKAEQIYKQIQCAEDECVQSEDESDEDDDNYENAQENHEYDDLSSEEEEGIDEEDENDEEEEECEDEDGLDDDEDDTVYQEFSANMISGCGYDSGCTACVALIKGSELYVANVGDSRCVVCRNGEALDMSVDHKPEDEPESTRITKAGGKITDDGRVNGGLNLSRALGDHSYKQNKDHSPADQMISPLPDVRSLTLTKNDSFMVIACDGIWNSLNSQEVCDFVSERLDKHTKLSQIAEEMFDHCLSPDSSGDGTGCDNMTCIIVKFLDLPESSKRSIEIGKADSDNDSREKKPRLEAN